MAHSEFKPLHSVPKIPITAFQFICKHDGAGTPTKWLASAPIAVCRKKNCKLAEKKVQLSPERVDPTTLTGMALACCAKCAHAGKCCHVAVATTSARDSPKCSKCESVLQICAISANADIDKWIAQSAACIAMARDRVEVINALEASAQKAVADARATEAFDRYASELNSVVGLKIVLKSVKNAVDESVLDKHVRCVLQRFASAADGEVTPERVASIRNAMLAEHFGRPAPPHQKTCDFCVLAVHSLRSRMCEHYERHDDGLLFGCSGAGCDGVMHVCKACRKVDFA